MSGKSDNAWAAELLGYSWSEAHEWWEKTENMRLRRRNLDFAGNADNFRELLRSVRIVAWAERVQAENPAHLRCAPERYLALRYFAAALDDQPGALAALRKDAEVDVR